MSSRGRQKIQNDKEHQKVEILDEMKEIQNLESNFPKHYLPRFFFPNQNQNRNSVHIDYKGPKLKQLKKGRRLISREVVRADRLDGLHSKTAVNSIEDSRRS